MAILRKVLKLLSSDEIDLLSEIEGRIEVFDGDSVSGNDITQLTIYLHSADECIAIFSDYEDVKFKFEFFFLNVSAQDSRLHDECVKLGEIDCNQIRLLLRAEWERPAKFGEVPPHYEQVIQCRGRLDDFPPDSNGCVSVVGILLEGDSDQGLVFVGDIPMQVGFSDDKEFIGKYLNDCWIIDLDKLEASLKDLEKMGFERISTVGGNN